MGVVTFEGWLMGGSGVGKTTELQRVPTGLLPPVTDRAMHALNVLPDAHYLGHNMAQ